MGRYIERAENTALAVEGACQVSLLPELYASEVWDGLLAMVGRREDFLAATGSPSFLNIVRFTLLDLDNPSSLQSSLRSAREVARAAYATLSPEVWESLNTFWLDLKDVDERYLESNGISPLIARVKEGTRLVRGAIYNTLHHDEAFRLIGLGTFLERADHIIRVLRARYASLLKESERGETIYYLCMAVLRSTGAVEAYRKVYRDLVTPWRVIELLILCKEVHCSLHTCLERIKEFLNGVPEERGRETVRLTTDLHLLLNDGQVKDVLPYALNEYLMDFARMLQELGAEIDKGFRVSLCA
jgi:uncharacterized alpha-E superfamily protein